MLKPNHPLGTSVCYWHSLHQWIGLKLMWWCHQKETFSALLAIFAGIPRWILAQRPVTRSFDVFIDLRPNKRLSKHWWDWWFETASRPLRSQCQLCVIYKQASFSRRSCMGKGKFDTKLLAIILYPVDPSYAQLKRRHFWSNRNRYGNTSGVSIHLSNPARLWTQQCSGNHCI